MELKDIKVLVVDDETDIVEMSVEFLREEGLNTVGVESPKEALEILKKESINVILSDMTMPGAMSGESFLKAVRTEFGRGHLFYFSTGNLDMSDEIVMKMGANGVLIKPYKYRELIERIKKHFNIT